MQPKVALLWRSSPPSEDKQLGHHSSAARWLGGAGKVLQVSTEGQSHLWESRMASGKEWPLNWMPGAGEESISQRKDRDDKERAKAQVTAVPWA